MANARAWSRWLRTWWACRRGRPAMLRRLDEYAARTPRHDYDSDPEHVAGCAKCRVWARLETVLEREEMA